MNDHKIIKIKKNEDGEITDVMLDNGSVMPVNQAILLAKRGELDDTIVVRGKDGGEFLRIDPNQSDFDNLAEFPTFK
ncbi:DUF3892 domain-containing protein [Sinanaerobacter chloroacetimidivorans]|uniref:DUF3892 domain-containing protein n=1 Tax=Sinanaerobacter chloroacetimidivorans TaxID=2818044 RepID=A0A8J7W3V1_9FIRM|nr:DUF3892 domain-containing protein [Sinanaerobacter chloroacetimidivorans]MBR0598873.1 DUF3892 domain-containing protein [Sinanaerobacter chloroacetimidivorans]